MPFEVIGKPIVINGRTIPLSKAIKAGDFVFLSGQLGANSDMVFPQNVAEQTELCILNIKTILNQCDLELSDVIKTTVWLTKIEYFQEFNDVYEKYFPSSPPCRSTVCSALMIPTALVEIEAIAYSKNGIGTREK